MEWQQLFSCGCEHPSRQDYTMKSLRTLAGLTLTGSLALAQGTVWFSNRQGQLVDAPFYDDQGRALEGTNYVTQLYFWKSDGGFQPAANPIPFNTNGYFFGGSVELNGIQECSAAWVQVRAWDARAGATFEEAALAGAWSGVSSSLFVSRVGSPSRPEACQSLSRCPTATPSRRSIL